MPPPGRQSDGVRNTGRSHGCRRALHRAVAELARGVLAPTPNASILKKRACVRPPAFHIDSGRDARHLYGARRRGERAVAELSVISVAPALNGTVSEDGARVRAAAGDRTD